MRKDLFLNKNDIEEIREKIEKYLWAENLYLRVQNNARRKLVTSEKFHPEWVLGRVLRDKALVYAISGRDSYVSEIVDLLAGTFSIARMSEPLESVDGWGYGMLRANHFAAFDLIKQHQKLGGRVRKRLERRFEEILHVQKEKVLSLKLFINTQFWQVCTVGILGFLLEDKRAIEAAMNGFKQALASLQDCLFWPEAHAYGVGYVTCVMTMLAEASLHNGGEDLYRYVTPSGNSLKSLYDGTLRLLLADGRIANCGDGSSQAEIVSKKEKHTGHDFSDIYVFNNRCYREKNIYEIAYRRYRDPTYAWILSQNPARDTWDHTFWGYAALTHGMSLGETVPPPSGSSVFPEYGCAIVRSEETSRYWHSHYPAIFLRNGSRQNHGHNDHFGMQLHAYGKNIYPDWFIQWDYSRGLFTHGRILNPTPYSKRLLAHNAMVVDRREPEKQKVTFSAIEYHNEMKVIRIEGFVYKGVKQRRILGLTREYLFERFEADSRRVHTYDYLLHSFGTVVLKGVGRLAPYNLLAEEYGLGKIDEQAYSPENIWIRPGKRATVCNNWEAQFKDRDGIGSRLFAVGEKGTEVLVSNTPYYVSSYGWDALPEDNVVRKMPFLIIRRRALRTVFTVVHQLFRHKPEPFRIRQTARSFEIQGRHFLDTISLPSMDFKRITIQK